MAKGTVSGSTPPKVMFYSTDDGGKDVFVHISAVERRTAQLNEGQKVAY